MVGAYAGFETARVAVSLAIWCRQEARFYRSIFAGWARFAAPVFDLDEPGPGA